MMFLDPTNLYGWIPSMKNSTPIVLPFHGLQLTRDDQVFNNLFSKFFCNLKKQKKSNRIMCLQRFKFA